MSDPKDTPETTTPAETAVPAEPKGPDYKRPLKEWETVDLLAFLKGELSGVPTQVTPGVIKEYARRESLEAAWSDAEVLAFYREGKTPPQTKNGVYVNDVTRPNRFPGEWSDEELSAWTSGEIAPKGKANEPKLAAELVRRFDLAGPATDVPAVLKQYRHKTNPAPVPAPAAPAVENKPVVEPVAAQPPGALTALNVSFIDTTLERYVKAVALSRQVGDEEGGAAQRQLDGLFSYVLRLEGKALKDGLDRVKRTIAHHRDGVFNPSNAYRFVHHLKGNTRHQAQHVNLIELFVIISGGNEARKKQVDIRHMLSGLPNVQAEMLTDYFKNHA